MITLTRASEMLACSREHLMRLARRGKLVGGKVGREWVFTEEALSRLVALRTPVKLKPVKRGRPRRNLP